MSVFRQMQTQTDVRSDILSIQPSWFIRSKSYSLTILVELSTNGLREHTGIRRPDARSFLLA